MLGLKRKPRGATFFTWHHDVPTTKSTYKAHVTRKPLTQWQPHFTYLTQVLIYFIGIPFILPFLVKLHDWMKTG